MAVSAFYGDRNGIKTNMYGQRNRHSASPPFGDVADRLIRIMVMLFPAPLRNQNHSISILKICQFLFSCCGIRSCRICFRSGRKKRTRLFCRQPAWRMQLPCRYPKERSWHKPTKKENPWTLPHIGTAMQGKSLKIPYFFKKNYCIAGETVV